MNKKIFVVYLLAAVLTGIAGAAEEKKAMPKADVVDVPAIGKGLCLSNIFQTNMVLQRDKPLSIWGWADPGEEITVSFAGRHARTKAAPDRSWQVTLEPVPANSTPQTMTVKGKTRTLTLENILVGDVWILGGQSNMEFEIAKVDDGPLEVVSANFPQIRLLTMPQGKGFDSVRSFERLHEWSSWWSRHFRKGDWDVCSPETVRDFSAIGYIFGRRLFMATGVPIGLIDASIGGTTVETWTPRNVLAKIDGKETRDMLKDWAEKIAAYDPQADLQRRIADYQRQKQRRAEQGNPMPADSRPPSDLRPGPAADKNRPGYCYASVIRPLEGLAVKGAVFHQGFNNCFNGSAGARMYYQVFGSSMMHRCRSASYHCARRVSRRPGTTSSSRCTMSACSYERRSTRRFVIFMTPEIRESVLQVVSIFERAGITRRSRSRQANAPPNGPWLRSTTFCRAGMPTCTGLPRRLRM